MANKGTVKEQSQHSQTKLSSESEFVHHLATQQLNTRGRSCDCAERLGKFAGTSRLHHVKKTIDVIPTQESLSRSLEQSANAFNRRDLFRWALGWGSVLRIDHCELCGGYIKTLVEDRSEDVFLADWTLIHLDIVAR